MKNLKHLVERALNELHWKDYFPKQFQVFHEKYNKPEFLEDPTRYFISFQSGRSDVLHKGISKIGKLNHDDPVGLYCYPMDLAINNPLQMYLATGYKNLLVVERKSNYVDLQNIGYNDLIKYMEILYPYFKKWFDFVYPLGEDYFRFSNEESGVQDAFDNTDGYDNFGKLFIGLLKYCHLLPEQELDLVIANYEDGDELDAGSTLKERLRTPEEQTQILKRMDIKCMLDIANNVGEAVLDINEPEQAVFLTRDAFKILEVFNLRKEDLGASVNLKHYTDKISKMVSAKIKDIGVLQSLDSSPSNEVQSYKFQGDSTQGILNFNFKSFYRDTGDTSRGGANIADLENITYKQINKDGESSDTLIVMDNIPSNTRLYFIVDSIIDFFKGN